MNVHSSSVTGVSTPSSPCDALRKRISFTLLKTLGWSCKTRCKLHTLLDLRGSIPSFLHISDGKLHAVNAPNLVIPETANATWPLIPYPARSACQQESAPSGWLATRTARCAPAGIADKALRLRAAVWL
jgi:hypothetical protein